MLKRDVRKSTKTCNSSAPPQTLKKKKKIYSPSLQLWLHFQISSLFLQVLPRDRSQTPNYSKHPTWQLLKVQQSTPIIIYDIQSTSTPISAPCLRKTWQWQNQKNHGVGVIEVYYKCLKRFPSLWAWHDIQVRYHVWNMYSLDS